jgi:two-component system sensor histidine kinase RegB
MGLGFFIAKTLLERSGATVTLGNPGRGAEISILWQRLAVETGASNVIKSKAATT